MKTKEIPVAAHRDQVLSAITAIVRRELRDEKLVIDEATQAQQVPGWDSLAHIGIILAVEKEFGIKLKAAEVASLQRIGTLIDLIVARFPAA